jgi:hypothetical protein
MIEAREETPISITKITRYSDALGQVGQTLFLAPGVS